MASPSTIDQWKGDALTLFPADFKRHGNQIPSALVQSVNLPNDGGFKGCWRAHGLEEAPVNPIQNRSKEGGALIFHPQPKWDPFENRQLAAASLSICARGNSQNSRTAWKCLWFAIECSLVMSVYPTWHGNQWWASRT